MAYGMISVVIYMIFELWAFLTVPSGPNVVPTEGPPVTLIATLMLGYSIHDLLVQTLIKNPRKHEYQGVVRNTFIFGTLGYAYMTFGCYGIVLLTKD